MRILYTRADGGVSIATSKPKADVERGFRELTDEEYIALVWERSVPKDATSAFEIDDNYVLPDREFRNAWVQDGKTVIHDLEKAREIQLDRIRLAREPKLIELDKEFMMALEKGLPTEEVATKKQILRDITEPLKVLELSSIEDVKAAFPEILKS